MKYTIGKSYEEDFVDDKMHDDEKKVLLLITTRSGTWITSSTLISNKSNR